MCGQNDEIQNAPSARFVVNDEKCDDREKNGK